MHVRFERAGRKGKTVTVASPVVLVREDAAGLLGDLKKACAAGGTLVASRAPDGRAAFTLEIQGDHVGAVLALLSARGFRTKGAPS